MTHKLTSLILTVALLAGLAGCKKNASERMPETSDAASSAAAAAVPVAPTSAAALAKFDITRQPLSEVALGDFPYIALPEGYSSKGHATSTKDFARFPFWVNGQPVWVEGKFYLADFGPVVGKDMSEYEVKKNFESVITQLGGVKLSEGKIPDDTIKGWGSEIQMGFIDGLGDVYNEPVTTYVIHRKDGDVWVHLVTTTAMGSYIVGRQKAFEQTASMLPASERK